MTRSQAYEILGLQPGATEAEIRKQFKKLAFRVHPDVNPSRNANDQFILITQAMELLMSPEVPHFQRGLNERQQQRRSRQEESPEQRAARMKEARDRFERQKQHTFRENRQYLEHLLTGRKWFVFKWINRIAIGLAIVLVLDIFLPFHYRKDELTAFAKNTYRGILNDRISAVELKESGTYFAKTNFGTWITSYPEVTVQESWFFHTPVAFYSSDDFAVTQTPLDFHIGSVRFILIVLLLFPLFTILRRKKDLVFVFMYQLSFWGVGLLELLILLTKDRLPHLLSLGFL